MQNLDTACSAQNLQKIGGKDAHGNFHFLFRTSEIHLEWRISYGKSGRAIIVTHAAKWSERSVPPKNGWKSNSGKIKHCKVMTQRSSLVYSLEQTERHCGSPTSDRGGLDKARASLAWSKPQAVGSRLNVVIPISVTETKNVRMQLQTIIMVDKYFKSFNKNMP